MFERLPPPLNDRRPILPPLASRTAAADVSRTGRFDICHSPIDSCSTSSAGCQFVDPAELADVLGEARATVHRALTGLLAEGIVGRVSNGTAHLPSSRPFYLTGQGVAEAAGC